MDDVYFFTIILGATNTLLWFLISKYASRFSQIVRILLVIPYLIFILFSIFSIQVLIGLIGILIWEEPDVVGNIFWFKYIIGPFCATYFSLSESSKLLPNVREAFVSSIGGFVCIFIMLDEAFYNSSKGLGFYLLIIFSLLGFYFAHRQSKD